MDLWPFSPVATAMDLALPSPSADDGVPDLYNYSLPTAATAAAESHLIAPEEFFADAAGLASARCGERPVCRLHETLTSYSQYVRQFEGDDLLPVNGDAMKVSGSGSTGDGYHSTVAEVPLHVLQMQDVGRCESRSSSTPVCQLEMFGGAWSPSTSLLSPDLETIVNQHSSTSTFSQQSRLASAPQTTEQLVTATGIETLGACSYVIIQVLQPNNSDATLIGSDCRLLGISDSGNGYCSTVEDFNQIVDRGNATQRIGNVSAESASSIRTLKIILPPSLLQQQQQPVCSTNEPLNGSSESNSTTAIIDYCQNGSVPADEILHRLYPIPAGGASIEEELSIESSLAGSIDDEVLELLDDAGVGLDVARDWTTLQLLAGTGLETSSSTGKAREPAGHVTSQCSSETGDDSDVVRRRKMKSTGKHGKPLHVLKCASRCGQKRRRYNLNDPEAVNEKKERRREQNRRAARGSRERRRERSVSVVQEFQRQQSIQTALKYEMQHLRQTETTLLKALVDHLETCPSSARHGSTSATTSSTTTDVITDR